MNGISRRGQKVVCVAYVNIWLGLTAETLRLYDGAAPEPDQVYTVDGFIESGMVMGAPVAGSIPGIALVEIPTALKCPSLEPIGWPIAAFRPVDERETDISALVRLGAPVKQTEPV